MSQIGDRLQTLRAERGLTQEQLAREADVVLMTVIRTERGRTTPSVATINKLARALEVSPAALLDDEADATPAATTA